jgi:hypothetical protein
VHDATRCHEPKRLPGGNGRGGGSDIPTETLHILTIDVRDGAIVARVFDPGLSHGLPVGFFGDSVNDEPWKFV